MTAIWKFKLELSSEQTIKVPCGARPLCAQPQAGSICIWMQLEANDKPLTERSVRIVGTGHPFEAQGLQYIGSVQIQSFVWHIYIEEESNA